MPRLSRRALEILQKIRKKKIRFIYLQFTDVGGALKSVTVNTRIFKEVLKSGNWFDGSSIEGYARIAESDMLLRPDLKTFAIIPWSQPERKAARLICDVYTVDGQPFAGDPRFILKKITDEARKMGFIFKVGAEIEFFLFERANSSEPIPHDRKQYFDYTPKSRATDILEQVILDLSLFGAIGEVIHHEVAHGQHEIDMRYSDALNTADNIITLKTAIKARASSDTTLKATFMPKPLSGINGSGMHVHQSFFQGRKNVFYRRSDKYNLSKLAYYFIAGQIKHARAITAILASTVNSYKRLVPGFEAPCYICWGKTNRSALIRIPSASPDKKAVAARAELRNPDPYCNPYLAFAVMLAAGLDGIKRKMPVRPATEENAYELKRPELLKKNISTLPTSLDQALECLSEDEIIKNALGPVVLESFLNAKQREIENSRQEVTPWELEAYL